MLRLITPTAGQVLFEGTDLASLDAAALRRTSPRDTDHLPGSGTHHSTGQTTVGAALELLALHRLVATWQGRRERAFALLDQVGLRLATAIRHSGQRQSASRGRWPSSRG
ncbi:MAG: hypothetical protein R3E68_01360 [Burkholderiaceae bacterium]